MYKSDCVFCKITKNILPAKIILEDDNHLAFLANRPNTEGFTVVITKNHYDSYFAELPTEVLRDLSIFCSRTAKLLDETFTDVGRTGLIFEGFGVNHIHAKLIPLHGTKDSEWQKKISPVDKYFDHYEGYISSHDYGEADRPEIALTYSKFK